MGNDDEITVSQIPWTLAPVDRLTFDDDTQMLADTLIEAMSQLRAMTKKCDQQSARILSLVAELRETRAEARALRAQVRCLQDIAA